jgi:arylsulfatase A-like enzyme
MAAGWAVAGNTPFAWTKQVASNYGGTRCGMIISWPGQVTVPTTVRSQWLHVIDVAPTVLEAAQLPEPKSVSGVAQSPIEGVSMLYTFKNPQAASTHKTQYFEIFGNRAIYHDGWFAGTVHKAPWETQPRSRFLNADARGGEESRSSGDRRSKPRITLLAGACPSQLAAR